MPIFGGTPLDEIVHVYIWSTSILGGRNQTPVVRWVLKAIAKSS